MENLTIVEVLFERKSLFLNPYRLLNSILFPYEAVKCLESCTGKGRGTCDTKTGLCICEDGTQGEICPGTIYISICTEIVPCRP